MRLHQLQKSADQLESAVLDQATAVAEHTRDGLLRGRRTFSDWEKIAGQSIRANPMLYAGAALVIIGLALVLKRPARRSEDSADAP
jgi:hypothetical protein